METTKTIQVIAGPGAGKTTDLVDDVIKVLPSLKQQRFLAVITYTNAATDKIRASLRKKIEIPENLYVGTIHSFLDRFILIPYASNLEIVPEQVVFIDEIHVSDSRYMAAATKNARDHGVITFEQIEWISKKIVCGGKIKVNNKNLNISAKMAKNHARIIGQRLQYIFVDEYQDATTTQHDIFKSLIKANVVDQFYCVGDPEQYIYGFTYRGAISKPDYKSIPINQLNSFNNVTLRNKTINRRSRPRIVKFINQFAKLKQTSDEKISDNNLDVGFIESTEQNEIINRFLELCEEQGFDDKKKFFLSYASKTIEFENITNVSEYEDASLESERLLSESLRLICGAIGKSKKKIIEDSKIDQLKLRKIAINIIKKIKTNPEITEKDIIQILESDHQIPRKANNKFTPKNFHSLRRIKLSLSSKDNESLKRVKSTIHKSKGLEAEAVLVIAKKQSELVSWLETDQDLRSKDKNDTCRLGFVAFSRARDFLCIACLENIDSSLRKKMLGLGIKAI